jgi:hypothetical protein
MEGSTLGRNPMYVRTVEDPSLVLVPLSDMGKLVLKIIPKYRMWRGLLIT